MSDEVEIDLKGIKLLVSVPSYDGNIPIEWMYAYMETAAVCAAHGVIVGLNARVGSSLIPKCRDEIIHQFLFDEAQQPFDYLLCIDADVVWKAEQIPQMLAAAIANKGDTIYGTYPVKIDDPLFHIEFTKTTDGKPVINGDLFRVNSGAAGFMLLSRFTLEHMYQKYDDLYYEAKAGSDFNTDKPVCAMFTPGIIRNKYRGEDIMFSIRLNYAGLKMWLDPRLELVHIGKKRYDHSFKSYLDNVVFKAD